jgi:haloacetate dehalogenase
MRTVATTAGTGLFPGATEALVPTPDGEIFVRMVGRGAPLLLLHGYPQTSAMWHRMTPQLADRYTVVAADLRGYGRSLKPPSAPDHATMTKRASAADMVAAMAALGHERFLVGSHDRGARVAHRMALDHPERVRAVAMLDIAPTREMYAHATSAFAQTYWHWYWLTQPAPFPERLIAADPRFFWLKCCGWGSAGLAPFHWVALDEYLERYADPDVIRCACEDYRAAWTTDIAHDDADGGRRIACPLLVNWGADGAIERFFDALALWRSRAETVEGAALAGGHYLAEEAPALVAAAWLPFFERAPA